MDRRYVDVIYKVTEDNTERYVHTMSAWDLEEWIGFCEDFGFELVMYGGCDVRTGKGM